MDFFAAEARAKGRTRSLIVYFILGVAGLVVTLNVLALIGMNVANASHAARYGQSGGGYGDDNNSGNAGVWNPGLSVMVTLGTLVVVGGACLYKISELRQGGAAVAESVGAAAMSPQTTDLAERRLRNIVEEMALASGVPVPPIYIIEEDSINAFAAGFHPEDAVVTVTRGALKYLNRDELQGVVAHEFSHILNGDMRLNVELIGAVFGLLVIAIIGRVLLQSVGRVRVRSSRDGGNATIAILAAGAALVAVGSLGVLFGRLIQASVSRQRERLADASGVQFTRNPSGLAGALKKIGGLGSLIEHAHVQETAHMFFAPAIKSMFATHPPLEERIRELDPQWDGKFVVIKPLTDASIRSSPASSATSSSASIPSAINPAQWLVPASVAAAIALDDIRTWRAGLPASITAALANAQGCRALLLALAFENDAAQRAAQLQRLQEFAEPAAQAAANLANDVSQVPPGRQLPLLELALGGLAQLPVSEKTFLLARMRDLTAFDRGQTLHQFALWRVAEYRLRPQPPRIGPTTPESYRRDLSLVLSGLAHLSTPDDAAAQPVFALGLAALPAFSPPLTLTARSLAPISEVEAACTRLEAAPFPLKKQLLEAGALVAQADGVVEPAEAELLRALAASLGCAVPPV
jgi:Zn-dependent protease with chaperone function